MSRHAYRLVFRLESPLHIGRRKINNLMQTRYYVPGRVFWGAVTAHLTRWLGGTDYRRVGTLVRDYLRFGYFFPAKIPDEPLYPRQDRQHPAEFVYGQNTLPEAKFEREFLNVVTSTAIAHETNAAEEASLHEVEFLTPSLALGRPVYLVGHLFVHGDEKITSTGADVQVQGISLFSQVLASLRIGGERRYGFGRLTLDRNMCQPVDEMFGYDLRRNEGRWCVTVPAQQPLLAHATTGGLRLSGAVEPLVSREWKKERGPGRQITLLDLCYAPGSLVTSTTTFAIDRYGIWKREDR